MKKLVILFLILLSFVIYGKKNVSTVMLQQRGRGVELSENTVLVIRMGVSDILTRKGYELVDEEIQKKVIREQAKQHSKGCYDNECLVETGQMLSAQAIFSIEIVKLGKIYIFNLKYIDTEKGTVERSTSLTYKSELNDGEKLLKFSKKITEEAFKDIKKVKKKYNSNYFINVDNNFLIGKYEVTQKEYKEIMGKNPSKFKGDNLPVENVSWYDAVKFCNKKSIKDGLDPIYTIDGVDVKIDYSKNGYRLPNQEEWKYAAKGGSFLKGYTFAGSNDIDEVAWYWKNSGKKTHTVGTKKPNKLGLYNMSGNVREWCNDWRGKYKVNCGGSWSDADGYIEIRTCGYSGHDWSGSSIGFRVLQSLK